MARVIRSPSWTPGRRTLELGNVLQDFQHLSVLSFVFWVSHSCHSRNLHTCTCQLDGFTLIHCSENRCWYDDVSVHLPWQCLDVWYHIQICSTTLFSFNNFLDYPRIVLLSSLWWALSSGGVGSSRARGTDAPGGHVQHSIWPHLPSHNDSQCSFLFRCLPRVIMFESLHCLHCLAECFPGPNARVPSIRRVSSASKSAGTKPGRKPQVSYFNNLQNDWF